MQQQSGSSQEIPAGGKVTPLPPREEFQIAVFCALNSEASAVEGIFDEIWEKPNKIGKAPADPYTYTCGKISTFYVVLVYLPDLGTASSSSVASICRAFFPNIKLGLVVGICGGVPNPGTEDEIILGDVIISADVKRISFGRVHENGFKPKNSTAETLSRATPEIKSFIKYLAGWSGSRQLKKDVTTYRDDLLQKKGFRSSRYPGRDSDKLFPSSYHHKHRGGVYCEACCGENVGVCQTAVTASCVELCCDEKQVIPRGRRLKYSNESENIEPPNPKIHFGAIGTGDNVVRSASYRDQLAKEHGVVAFEMESGGAWDNIPTMVVKSVCDYADSHKNKRFQLYSAAVAAACLKALLNQWDKVESTDGHSDAESSDRRKPSKLSWFIVFIAVLTAFILPLVLQASGHLPIPLQPTASSISTTEYTGIDPKYPIFAILGKTGVGKSSFIAKLGARNSSGGAPEICHGMDTCTNELTFYEATVDNRSVYLLDTPGFDDTHLSDEQIMVLIVDKLRELSLEDKLVKGLVYLHDITQTRFGGLAENHVYFFQKLCGVDAYTNVMFVTTKWQISPMANVRESELQHQREAELKTKHWKPMIDHGSRVERYDGTSKSARLIISILLNQARIMRFNVPQQAKQAEHGDHQLSVEDDKSKTKNAGNHPEQAAGTDAKENEISPEYNEYTPEGRDSSNTKTSKALRYLLLTLRFLVFCHVIFAMLDVLFNNGEAMFEPLPFPIALFIFSVYIPFVFSAFTPSHWWIYYDFTRGYIIKFLVLVVDFLLLGIFRDPSIHFVGFFLALVTFVLSWFRPDV